MRVINSIPWSPTEIESYRQVIWDNLIDGMIRIRAVMDELNLETSEDNSVRSSWEWGGYARMPYLFTGPSCRDDVQLTTDFAPAHRRSSIKWLAHSTWEVSSRIHLSTNTSSKHCGKTLQCRRCDLFIRPNSLGRLSVKPQAISKGKKLALPDKCVPPITVLRVYGLT